MTRVRYSSGKSGGGCIELYRVHAINSTHAGVARGSYGQNKAVVL